MLCERCGKNPATEMHICSECAREIGASMGESFQGMLNDFGQSLFNTGMFAEPFGLGNFLSGFMGTPDEENETDLKCKYCGRNYSDFMKTGFLGCPGCYVIFRDRLSPLIKRIHGSNSHVGKVPRRKGGDLRVKREIKDLKNQMNASVKKEEFETAAQLRDKIKELEKKLDG